MDKFNEGFMSGVIITAILMLFIIVIVLAI